MKKPYQSNGKGKPASTKQPPMKKGTAKVKGK